VSTLARPFEVNGRTTFVPLGEPELEALARLHHVCVVWLLLVAAFGFCPHVLLLPLCCKRRSVSKL
jgi:hypothetical protein